MKHKRWFPVNQDINGDPEVWAMRHELGEKSLSIWLEILSIADRNGGIVPGELKELIRSIAGRCQARIRTVEGVIKFASSRLWLTFNGPMKVVNYAKYHRSRALIRHPPNLTYPNLTKPNQKEIKKSPLGSDFLLPDWLPKVEWEEFVEHRKHKRAELTESTAKRIIAVLRELMEMGYAPANVLTEAIDRNWTGLKKEWVHRPGSGFGREKDNQLSPHIQAALVRGLK